MSNRRRDLEDRAVTGDTEAIGELIEDNIGLYHHIATSFFPQGADQGMIEDLRQEGVLCILQHIAKFDPDRGEWKYFSGIYCRKGVVRYLKKHRQVTQGTLIEDLEDEMEDVDTPSPADAAHYHYRNADIAMLMETLTDDEREVLRRKVWEGESYMDIDRSGFRVRRNQIRLIYLSALEKLGKGLHGDNRQDRK